MQYSKNTNCEIAQLKYYRREWKKLPEVKVDNLEAEMKRNKISRSDIANLLGLSYRTIHSRFNGESEWGYAECVKVRDAYFPDKTLDYLFETEEKERWEEMKVFITIIILISVCNWIKWRVATLALIYYNEKNQYKHPNKEEMRVCINFVVRNLLKDLTGR